MNSLFISGPDVSKSIVALADAVSHSKTLRHLGLACDIPASRFADFATTVATSDSAMSFFGVHGTLEKSFWPVLGQFLVDYRKLTSLSLRETPTAGAGLPALTQHLRKGSSIRKLDLSDCNFTKKDFGSFPDLIAQCNIQSLDISRNKITDEFASIIGSALMYSETLLEYVRAARSAFLFRAFRGAKDRKTKNLPRASHCRNIHPLWLYLSFPFLITYSYDLHHDFCRSLHVAEAQLSSAGLSCILSALRKVCKLYYLNASKNAVTDAVLEELILFVRADSGLGLLDLRSNPMTNSDPESFRDLLLVPHTCTLLVDV